MITFNGTSININENMTAIMNNIIDNVKSLFKHNEVITSSKIDLKHSKNSLSIDYADLLTNGSIPRIKYQLSKLIDPVLIVNNCEHDDIRIIMSTLDNAKISSMARIIINYDD